VGENFHINRGKPLFFETVQEFFENGGLADQFFAQDGDVLPISVPEIRKAFMEKV